MLHAWNEGMASVRSARKDNKLKGLTNYIEAAGFSDPTPPERQGVIGRSELLRKPQSKKSK
jgi:serine/threonine-protein kinase HipA